MTARLRSTRNVRFARCFRFAECFRFAPRLRFARPPSAARSSGLRHWNFTCARIVKVTPAGGG
ncbi:MAG: hypothetical protein ACRDM0_17740, partial [Thermoleophilaceae bacterium]